MSQLAAEKIDVSCPNKRKDDDAKVGSDGFPKLYRLPQVVSIGGDPTSDASVGNENRPAPQMCTVTGIHKNITGAKGQDRRTRYTRHCW